MSDQRFELPEINTWRLFNKAVSQEKVISMVESWEVHGYRFGCVCIDDGWTIDGKLGDWVPDPMRFPDFAGMADWIHRKGYAIRLWVAPAQFHPGTNIAKLAFPEFTLHNAEGEPAFYSGLGTFRIDTRTEFGRNHIREVMQRLVSKYNVDAFKVDFPPFYVADDEFYRQMNFAFSDYDQKAMISAFYRIVRESIDAVNPQVHIECARDLPGCEAYINDTICGDLVGDVRDWNTICRTAARLRAYSHGKPIVPWLEMAWGEGSDFPKDCQEWYAGMLEWIAASMNYELKIEHSFLPFKYPNADQIRCLTNLYGARNSNYKVLAAGRQTVSVSELINSGVEVNANTRFLVAPEQSITITLHTGVLGTNSLAWKARNVLTNTSVDLRARNELWEGTTEWCCVMFEADARQVYELWHEGTPDPYFLDLHKTHVEEK